MSTSTIMAVPSSTISSISSSILPSSATLSPTSLFTTISPDVFHASLLWALIAGFALAFLLGFGMGANDVANAFGTSVGSKVLKLRMAYILATIVETFGAVLVGYNVTDAMRKEVINTKMYDKTPNQFMIGQVAILAGGSVWLLIATLLKLPVSTTHSIVGATLGFTLVMRGFAGIGWTKITEIAISWVLSPVLSGFVSASLYMIVDFAVLRRRNPIKCGLCALPIFYFFCIAFNTFAVTYNGSKVLGLNEVNFWVAMGISIGMGTVSALIVQFVLRPRIIEWIYAEKNKNDGSDGSFPSHFRKLDKAPRISIFSAQKISPASGNNAPISFSNIQLATDNYAMNGIKEKRMKTKANNERKQSFRLTPKGFISWFFPHKARREDPHTLRMFGTIQIFTACFAGFAHGANDVSNAIAPLVALISVWNSQTVEQREPTQIWILLYGVAAICAGLWLLGHRVIKTVCQRMSEINPCSGFTIEFGAAVTVLIASKLGLPISTTHCLVGSVVAVGTVKSGNGIDWHIFASIATSWIVTLPISAALSAGMMWILSNFIGTL